MRVSARAVLAAVRASRRREWHVDAVMVALPMARRDCMASGLYVRKVAPDHIRQDV